MNHSFFDELRKIAATRSVKEWRAASGLDPRTGQNGQQLSLFDKGPYDPAHAAAIAGASHQLGSKPRYLKDLSTGGEEAGVDLMMGHRAGPTGESNQGGLLARKLYKPDSLVSQAEFTPQLLQQKQTMTDTARALSPEAKAMVPAMYGHDTMNAGTSGQRTTSFHEYVPGLSDLRGKKVDGQYSRPAADRAADLTGVQQHVLDPMAAKGMTMADTVRRRPEHEILNEEQARTTSLLHHPTSPTRNLGVNYGNVMGSAQGAKVLDFLPSAEGQANPAIESMKKYAPVNGPSRFTEGRATVGQLRKEVFKPTTPSLEAPYADRVQAHMSVGAAPPAAPPGQTPAGRVAGWMPAAKPAATGGELATGAASPMARAPVPHLPSSGTTDFLRGAGTATKGFFGRAAAHI